MRLRQAAPRFVHINYIYLYICISERVEEYVYNAANVGVCPKCICIAIALGALRAFRLLSLSKIEIQTRHNNKNTFAFKAAFSQANYSFLTRAV